jgi:5-formyltetrahydrofolate cyclo-ligase
VAGKIAAGDNSKTALRKEIIAARDVVAPATRGAWSAGITPQLVALAAWRNARCVLAYMNFGSEFSTAALIEDALAGGKTLCLPRVDRATRRLALHRIENIDRDLVSGVWGIREPRADCPPALAGDIDFVLLPGVAFTPRCERLGYGGGFYDRLIPQLSRRPPLVAAAFSLQVCDRIPLDTFDQRVDRVITEDAVYARE